VPGDVGPIHPTFGTQLPEAEDLTSEDTDLCLNPSPLKINWALH